MILADPSGLKRVFDRPVFIVAAPRSGSTLLFEILTHARDFWTIGGESHGVFERIPALRPFADGRNSNQLGAEHADPETSGRLLANFLDKLRDRDAVAYDRSRAPRVRLLEKTPKNSLRIPFLNAVFPDALFIYLHREPRENISSIMEAWRSGRFVTYRAMPGWDGNWSLLLPPGWPALRGQPLQRAAAFQWAAANGAILDNLARLDPRRWTSIGFADLIADPAREIRRLCAFCDVAFDERLGAHVSDKLPVSRYTLTAPAPDKWKKNEAEVNSVLPEVEAVNRRIRETVAAHRRNQERAGMA
jgi:hypothetical protein